MNPMDFTRLITFTSPAPSAMPRRPDPGISPPLTRPGASPHRRPDPGIPLLSFPPVVSGNPKRSAMNPMDLTRLITFRSPATSTMPWLMTYTLSVSTKDKKQSG